MKTAIGVQNGSASKKRGFNEAMSAGKMDVDSQGSFMASAATIPDDTEAFWSNVDRLKSLPAAFNSGKLIRIDSKSFLGALTLCRAQLYCAKQQMAMNNDPQ